MEYFYFAGKEKIRLVEQKETIAVGIRPETSESKLAALNKSTEFPPVQLSRYPTLFAAEEERLASFDVLPQARYATKVFYEPKTNKRLVLTDEITIRFKRGVSENDIAAFAAQFHLQQVQKSRFVNEQRVFRLKDSPVTEVKVLKAANALNDIDDVSFAQPNFLFEFQKLCQGPSYFSQQWHLRNIGQNGGLMREDVHAKEAWDITKGNADIVVAVIDDGVDIEHPALRSNIWTNPNPDPDLDDRNGYNFYDDDNNPRPRYFRLPHNRMTGNDIHGTPCAGLIASVAVNGACVLGVAHGCQILPVKIWGADDLAPSADVAEAIRYAGMHADVLSCSWSCAPDADIHQALIDVKLNGRDGKGCPVFCATGNNWLTPVTPVSYPARYSEAIAVGASTNLGVRYPHTYPHRRIYLVLDNWHNVHNHPKTVAKLEELSIIALWQPTYMPQSNPIEQLWRHISEKILRIHRLSDQWDVLKQRVLDWLSQFTEPSEKLLQMVGLLGRVAIRTQP